MTSKGTGSPSWGVSSRLDRGVLALLTLLPLVFLTNQSHSLLRVPRLFQE